MDEAVHPTTRGIERSPSTETTTIRSTYDPDADSTNTRLVLHEQRWAGGKHLSRSSYSQQKFSLQPLLTMMTRAFLFRCSRSWTRSNIYPAVCHTTRCSNTNQILQVRCQFKYCLLALSSLSHASSFSTFASPPNTIGRSHPSTSSSRCPACYPS